VDEPRRKNPDTSVARACGRLSQRHFNTLAALGFYGPLTAVGVTREASQWKELCWLQPLRRSSEALRSFRRPNTRYSHSCRSCCSRSRTKMPRSRRLRSRRRPRRKWRRRPPKRRC